MGIFDNIATKFHFPVVNFHLPRVDPPSKGLADWCKSAPMLGGPIDSRHPDSFVSKTVAAQLVEIDGSQGRAVHRAWFGTLVYSETDRGLLSVSDVLYSFKGTVETTHVTTGDLDQPLEVEVFLAKEGVLFARLSGAGLDPAIWASDQTEIVVNTDPDSNGTIDCQIENPPASSMRFKTILSPTLAISRS